VIGAILRAKSVLAQVSTTASIVCKVNSTMTTDASITNVQVQPISPYPHNASVSLVNSAANTAVLRNFVTSVLQVINSTKVGATINVRVI